jgi:hypothetical protein
MEEKSIDSIFDFENSIFDEELFLEDFNSEDGEQINYYVSPLADYFSRYYHRYYNKHEIQN